MRRFLIAFLFLLAPILGISQVPSTTYVGTVRDLTGAVVTSGRITFTLNAPSGGSIPGIGSFVATTVSCLINATGNPVASSDGVSPCVIADNVALTPTGTSYTMCRQPYNITPGSCVVTFANGGTADVSNIIPTPATMPNYGFPSSGPIGPSGPPNSLAIGTVIGGSSAAASIIGSAPSQILNLTLPQGATGPIGPIGPIGPVGAAGAANWRGNWTATTAYAVNDAFTQATIGYIVVTAYTSGSTFGSLDTSHTVQIAVPAAGLSGSTGLPLQYNGTIGVTFDPTLQGSNHNVAPDSATTIPYPFLFGQIPPAAAGVNTGIRNEGDSITFGVAAAANLGYAPQVDIYAGQATTLLNTAIPGSQACDTTKRMFNRWSPVTASWTIPQTIYDGTNDANQGGVGNHEIIFSDCLLASVAYATSVLASTGGTVTPATNWAVDNTYSQVPAVTSSTNGAVQTFPYTTTATGQGIVVFYRKWDGNQGEASIADNGGATTSSIFGGSQPNNGGANINTLLGTTSTVGALYMPNSARTAGAHTITVTVTSPTGIQGGTGFTSNPSVFFTATCANTQATATATATAGSIAVTLVTGGAYTCTPYAFVIGGGGVNAPLIATLAGGAILTVPIGYGGVYTSAPTLTASECSGTGAVLTPTMTSTGGGNFTISGVVVTSGGSGFTCGPYISATGGGGGGATFGLPTIAASAVNSLALDTSNQVSILGVAVVPPSITATTPAVWVLGQGRQQNDLFSASTAAYDSDIRTVVQTAQSMGAAAYYVNTRNALQGNATDMIGIHPTTAGHAQLAAYLERPAPAFTVQSSQQPLTGPSSTVNGIGPGFVIASFPAYIPCDQPIIQLVSSAGTLYMPPANSCPLPIGQTVQNHFIKIANAFNGTTTLSTAHGNATNCGNVNGSTLTLNQSVEVFSVGACWFLIGPPFNGTSQTLTTTTLAGTTLFSGNTINWLNSADATENFDLRAGATADQIECFTYANHSNTPQWTTCKDASNNFNIADSVSGVNRLALTQGGATDIHAIGTNPVRIGFGGGGGTGGIQVCNASSTCLFQVTGAGALTAPSYGQSAASSTGGTCTMSTTSCTITLGHTYTTPVCIATAQGSNVTGAAAACSVSGTTVTVTATTSNTNVWGAFVFGNPN